MGQTQQGVGFAPWVADALGDVQGLVVAAAGLVVLGLGAGALGQTPKGVGFAHLVADALGDVQGLAVAAAGLVVLRLGAGALGQTPQGVGDDPVIAALLPPPEEKMNCHACRRFGAIAFVVQFVCQSVCQFKPILQPPGQRLLGLFCQFSAGQCIETLLGQFAVALAPGQVRVVEAEPGSRARGQFALARRRDQSLRGGPIPRFQSGFDGRAHLLPDGFRLNLQSMVEALLLVLLACVPAPGPALQFLPAAQIALVQMGQHPCPHSLVIEQPFPAPVADKGLAGQTTVEIVVVGLGVVGGPRQVGEQGGQQPHPVQAAGHSPSPEQPVAIPQTLVFLCPGLVAQTGQVVVDDVGDALFVGRGQLAQTGKAIRRIQKEIAEEH